VALRQRCGNRIARRAPGPVSLRNQTVQFARLPS